MTLKEMAGLGKELEKVGELCQGPYYKTDIHCIKTGSTVLTGIPTGTPFGRDNAERAVDTHNLGVNYLSALVDIADIVIAGIDKDEEACFCGELCYQMSPEDRPQTCERLRAAIENLKK